MSGIDTQRCKLVSSIILFCTIFCGSKLDKRIKFISAIEDDIGRCDLVMYLSNNIEITYDELKNGLEKYVDHYQVIDYIVDLIIVLLD